MSDEGLPPVKNWENAVLTADVWFHLDQRIRRQRNRQNNRKYFQTSAKPSSCEQVACSFIFPTTRQGVLTLLFYSSPIYCLQVFQLSHLLGRLLSPGWIPAEYLPLCGLQDWRRVWFLGRSRGFWRVKDAVWGSHSLPSIKEDSSHRIRKRESHASRVFLIILTDGSQNAN